MAASRCSGGSASLLPSSASTSSCCSSPRNTASESASIERSPRLQPDRRRYASVAVAGRGRGG
eukprot:4519087-Prymnesium_polylepis.1